MSDTQQVIIHCVFSRAYFTSALSLEALEVYMAIGQVILHGFLKSNHWQGGPVGILVWGHYIHTRCALGIVIHLLNFWG